jgi:spermidine synthase
VLPIRVVLSFALLIMPTALMGATLPIILKSSLARTDELAGRIGLLYAANTFGAIAGTFVAGFWLIGGLGISRSIQLAAVVNGLVGLSAIVLQRWATSPIAAGEPVVDERARRVDAPNFSPIARRTALIAYGLSGVCSFAYEVVWTRMLGLVLDTSIYAFVTMLSMVLVGIAVGSAVVTPALQRRWNWPLGFAVIQLLVAIGALWSVWAVSNLADVRAWLEVTPGFQRLVATTVNFNFVVAALAILPSTLLIGATFPVAARIYTAGLDRPAERLGEIYSVNVFGAIFGSILGGFVLLPLFGTQTSLLIVSLASIGLAAALALAAERPRPNVRMGLIGFGAAVFALLWVGKPDLYQVLFETRFPDGQVLWFREGLETTVTIVRDSRGYRTLYTNSRGQANDEPALVNFHRQVAHLPLLVKPNASKVLIVGLGSGGSAGSILQHDGTQVEVIELSDAVIEGAAQFAETNYDVLRHPDLTLRIADGRNHLLTTQKKYALVTNDTIQPYDAGSTNLYSAEFYRLVLDALEWEGVLAQWIAPHDDYQYKMMLRTLLSVFPHVTLWLGADLVIASREPVVLDLAATARRFESDSARVAMKSVGFEDPSAAARWFVASREEIEAFVGPGPILTDDRPQIEYFRSLPSRGQGALPDIWAPFSRDSSKIMKR